MLQEYSKSGFWKVYGDLEAKVLVSGHSHTYAMLCAMQNRSEFHNSVAVVTQADFSQHRIHDYDYWDFVAELSTSQTTAISWNGNQHNVHFLLDTNETFIAYGLNQANETNAPVIPISQIKELFRPTFYELEMVLERFKDASNLILLGTPAPKPMPVIKKFLMGDNFYQDMAKSLGIELEKVKVSSDSLRVFMWEITQNLTQQLAIKFGCKFLPVPKVTLAANKTLADGYWADDVTHANEDFGALMIQELLHLEKQLNGN